MGKGTVFKKGTGNNGDEEYVFFREFSGNIPRGVFENGEEDGDSILLCGFSKECLIILENPRT